MPNESLLHLVQVADRAEALDRGDLVLLMHHRQRQAAIDPAPVDENGAGAALARDRQPFLLPVRPRCSRNRSRTVVRISGSASWACPLIMNFIVVVLRPVVQSSFASASERAAELRDPRRRDHLHKANRMANIIS